MPLKAGKANIGSNISELEDTGRKPKQAIAIALSKAYDQSQKPKTILRKKDNKADGGLPR